MALRKVQNSRMIDKNVFKHLDKETSKQVAEKTLRLAMIDVITELPFSDLACIFPFAVYNESGIVRIEVKAEVSDLGKHTLEAFENKLAAIIETL